MCKHDEASDEEPRLMYLPDSGRFHPVTTGGIKDGLLLSFLVPALFVFPLS